MKASEGVDFARAVKAPRNLAIHDRVYSEAGLGIVDGHMNAFLPREGLEYVRLADGKDLDMTTTPSPAAPTPEGAKVTELEQKLADAAAEVAKVQAELSNARAADPNHPQVPVPYDGHAPVVMINGQQVPAGGTVDLSAMLGGMFGGAGTSAAARQRGRDARRPGREHPAGDRGQRPGLRRRPDRRPVPGHRSGGAGPGPQLAGAARHGRLRRHVRCGTRPRRPGEREPAGGRDDDARPGARRCRTPATPGEVSGSGSRMLAWFAAILVLGLIGVLVYLGVTN